MPPSEASRSPLPIPRDEVDEERTEGASRIADDWRPLPANAAGTSRLEDALVRLDAIGVSGDTELSLTGRLEGVARSVEKPVNSARGRAAAPR